LFLFLFIFLVKGTIVEWTVSVGQAVKEGDVVAMVETDKVTVDIKAETDGVVIEQFVAVYVAKLRLFSSRL